MADKNQPGKIESYSIRIKPYALILAILWSALVCGSLAWGVYQARQGILESVKIQARDSFIKDVVYRHWNAKHGGVYVRITDDTPPNPYLKVPERDIKTLSGMKLTLMNPAYMTRQVHEIAAKLYGIQSHITSLNPIRPANAPDLWETKALKAFQNGVKEVSSLEKVNGNEHMRFMQPLITEKGCLKCHAEQGYKVGDIRGGISVSVPMADFWAIEKFHILTMSLGHGLLLIVGLVGIGIGASRLGRQFEDRKQAEELGIAQRDLALKMSTTIGLEETLQLCLETAIHISGMDCGGIYLIDDATGALNLVHHKNLQPDFVSSVSNYGVESPNNRLIMAGKAIYTEHQQLGVPLNKIRKQEALRAIAVLPVHHEDHVIAALNVASHVMDEVPPFARTALEAIAAQIGSVISRVQAERDMETFRSQLQEAQKMARLGYWLWDIETGKVKWSDEVFRIFGLDPETFTPQIDSILELSPWPEDHQRDKELIGRAIESHEPGNYEQKFLRPGGSIGHYFSTFQGVYDDKDVLTAIKGTIQDITEHKRTEEELRLSQERMQAILEASPDPVVVYDDAGCATFLNPAFTSLFGWSFEELLGRRIPFVPEDQNEESQAAIDKLLKRGGTATMETKRLTKDGREVDVLVSAAVISDENGKPAGMVVNLTDLTMLRKMETQLLQSQKMESVGRLAGGIAHDFNNMLGVILGNTEIVMEQADLIQPFYNNLQQIHKAALHSADITRQLLGFARKQTIAPEVLDLNEAVTGILKMLRRLIGEDINLTWVPGKKLWPIRVDPSQLDQVLANLCVNARDATADGGKLTIETDKVTIDETYCSSHQGFVPGDFVMLTISDDGCGMNKETLDNLFEPFFTTKGLDKGTGLGLATVYGIVKQNRGFINVYSELNQGTSFKVYLPRYDGIGKQAVQKNIVKPDLSGNETILVVEDEPDILSVIAQILEHQGYKLLTATTPGEAVSLAREYNGDIHLLMTDVVMPKMNGRDLARNLLTIYPNIKRLFMSGYTANVIAHHGILDEGVNFIQKPFSIQDLSLKVREVLDEE